MVAVAIDLGAFSADRRDLQNAADAIALAAALELPDQNDAEDAALDWAEKNGIDPDTVDLTFTAQSIPSEPNPKVRVELARDHEFTFARLIGITSSDVEAASTAIKTSPAGGDGVVPLSVTEDALAGAVLGDLVTLKYDANNISAGNTSPIRIDGPGSGNCDSSDRYCDGVMFGSDNVVCAEGIDPSYCSGPSIVDTQTGNVVGGTREAIQWRLDTTDTHCDEFTEVFEDDPTTNQQGTYRLTNVCNPYLAGSYTSNRVVIVPVIEELCNGSCEVTIVDFALFFLEEFGTGDTGNGNGNGNNDDNGNGNPNGCTGTDCEVVGRFIRVGQNVGLLAGTYNPDALNQFVRLVE
jgi:Flp pilus assembly protein TadG